MNIRQKNRRDFLKYSTVLAAVAGTGMLSSCASFDDYLFDDKNNLDEQVVIIGGGIAGLYLAHQLRSKQVQFRLYEASAYMGGRIKSAASYDYGASILSKKDVLVNALIDELKINRIFLDKENFYLAEGMEFLIEKLKERIIGLIPYRNFRMRSQLVEVQRLSSEYELTFQMDDGQKKIRCQKIALSIPPSQWSKVKGLMDLPEMESAKTMLASLQTESAIKLILPLAALPNTPRPISEFELSNFIVRQVVKKKQSMPVELDIKYQSNIIFSIDYVYNEIRKKLQITYPFQRMSADQYFGWAQAQFVQGAYFKMNTPYTRDLNSSIQVLGDSVSALSPNRVEGALQSAKAAAEAFI